MRVCVVNGEKRRAKRRFRDVFEGREGRERRVPKAALHRVESAGRFGWRGEGEGMAIGWMDMWACAVMGCE